jgi:integrase
MLARAGLAAGGRGVDPPRRRRSFTDPVRGRRLYGFFHLVTLRGLRCGEAAGLRWSDLDLDAGTLTVSGQLQQLGGRMTIEPLPAAAGVSRNRHVSAG